MGKRAHNAVATLGLATLFQLPPAAFALNLTGEWTGSTSCTSFDGTLFRLPRSTITLYISHSATTLTAHLQGGEGPTDYAGQSVSESGISSRLRAIMVECNTSPTLLDRSEVVHLKAAESADSARLKGSSIFRGQDGDIGTCRWTFSRVNKNDPGLAGCP